MSLRAKKSFGQNFLNAPRVINRMLEVSEVAEGDLVIEVGPGKGALTIPLLERGARVIAFELDPRMVDFLGGTLASYVESGQLTLVQNDILDVDISRYTQAESYKVVANIPYYITNAIMRFFLESNHQPVSMCVLVQKEVAERIARDKSESILSLSVKAYGTPRFVTKVPARYFSPKPKVDSAVLLVSDISRSVFTNRDHEKYFFELVKRGFQHKRKKLVSNLSDKRITVSEWEKRIVDLGFQVTVRAQELRLGDWVKLSRE